MVGQGRYAERECTHESGSRGLWFEVIREEPCAFVLSDPNAKQKPRILPLTRNLAEICLKSALQNTVVVGVAVA